MLRFLESRNLLPSTALDPILLFVQVGSYAYTDEFMIFNLQYLGYRRKNQEILSFFLYSYVINKVSRGTVV